MSFPAMPDDGRAHGRPARTPGSSPLNGALSEPAASGLTGRREDGRNLVVLTIALLCFILLAVSLAQLSVLEALKAAVGCATIAVLVIHGKSMLLCVGRRLLGQDSARSGRPDER